MGIEMCVAETLLVMGLWISRSVVKVVSDKVQMAGIRLRTNIKYFEPLADHIARPTGSRNRASV